MNEIVASHKTSTPPGVPATEPPKPSKKRGPSIYQIYSLPAPIQTFPLPAFYPNNPLSLFHAFSAWIRQVLFPPLAEPSVIHDGVWSEATVSVHVTKESSMRALWEQGFYGKGNLSRSEPNWLKREQVRLGLANVHVSEILTVQRREERAQAKWERARAEQEAIRNIRLQEVNMIETGNDFQAAKTQPAQRGSVAPVGSLQLLSLPNSDAKIKLLTQDPEPCAAPVGPLQLVSLPNSDAEMKNLDNLAESHAAPVGPFELLSLPNSDAEMKNLDNLSESHAAPVGPLELLSLPNSDAEMKNRDKVSESLVAHAASLQLSPLPNLDGDMENLDGSELSAAPVGPRQLLLLPNSEAEMKAAKKDWEPCVQDHDYKAVSSDKASACDEKLMANLDRQDMPCHGESSMLQSSEDSNSAQAQNDSMEQDNCSATCVPDAGFGNDKSPSRQKSVRFSARVESTTFELSDPPSPKAASIDSLEHPANGNGKTKESLTTSSHQNTESSDHATEVIVNREHLQLTPQEAFFLSFGLGALRVLDGPSGGLLSTTDMLRLFRQYSYFPCRDGPDDDDLQPDDGFLVNYVVYHHFRSLGWVPRAGIKFGVDWLLYTRGPVFDHAEFGLVVVPSYSDAWWRLAGKKEEQKTWSWLHGVVRVLSHVTKSLVLIYVEVPSRPKFEEALEAGIAEALKLYKVREVAVKRWSSNRNR